MASRGEEWLLTPPRTPMATGVKNWFSHVVYVFPYLTLKPDGSYSVLNLIGSNRSLDYNGQWAGIDVPLVAPVVPLFDLSGAQVFGASPPVLLSMK